MPEEVQAKPGCRASIGLSWEQGQVYQPTLVPILHSLKLLEENEVFGDADRKGDAWHSLLFSATLGKIGFPNILPFFLREGSNAATSLQTAGTQRL